MNDETFTMYEYRYSVEDCENSSVMFSYRKFDLTQDRERQYALELAANDYYSSGGFERRSWVSNDEPLKFYLWLDEDTKYAYYVWCEFQPYFSSSPIQEK